MIDKYTQQTPALKTVFNDTTMLTVDEKAEVKNLAVSGEADFYNISTSTVDARTVDTQHFYSSYDAQFKGTATFDGETNLNDITNFNGITNFNNEKAVFNGKANFEDDVNFYGNLSVDGPALDITIDQGQIAIKNSFTFNGETHNDEPGNIVFNVPTTFDNDTYLKEIICTYATFADKVTINGPLDVTSSSIVFDGQCEAKFYTAARFYEYATFADDVHVLGSLHTINVDSVYALGPVVIGPNEAITLDEESTIIDSPVYFNKDIAINSTAYVAGPLFIGGDTPTDDHIINISTTDGFHCNTYATFAYGVSIDGDLNVTADHTAFDGGSVDFYKNTAFRADVLFEKGAKFEYPAEFANTVSMQFGASVTTMYATGPVVVGPNEKITLDEESTIIDSPVYFNSDLYIGDVNVAREYGPVNLMGGYFDTAAGFTYAITVPPTASENCVITDNATQTTLATIKPNSQGVIVAMSPRTNYTGTCNVVEVFKLAAPLTFTGNTSGTSGDSSLLELIKTENLIFRGTDNDVTFGYHLPDASHLFSTNSYRDGDTTLGTARSKAFFDADITGDVVCDLTGVTNAENMFYFSSLSSFTATGTEDIINVDGMFGYASNLISFDAPLPKWTGTSGSGKSIFNCNLQSFKSNLKSFNPPHGYAYNLFGMPVSGGLYLNHFEVSEPMSALVDGYSMFSYTHLSTFICPGMPNLQNASLMFDNCALSYDSLANITNALPTLTSPGAITLSMGEEVQPADCEWWISQIESKGWNVQISYASESTAATLLSEEEPKTWYTSITVYEENHPAAKYCAWQNADGQIVGLNAYNYVTNPDDYYLASNLADAVAHFGLTQRTIEE